LEATTDSPDPRDPAQRSEERERGTSATTATGSGSSSGSGGEDSGKSKDWRRGENRRGGGRRGGKRRRSGSRGEKARERRAQAESARSESGEPEFGRGVVGVDPAAGPEGRSGQDGAGSQSGGERPARSRRRGQRRRGQRSRQSSGRGSQGEAGGRSARAPRQGREEVEGLLIFEHKGHALLRPLDGPLVPDKKRDVHLSPRMVQQLALRDGSVIKGVSGPGQGKHRLQLQEVLEVDGEAPKEMQALPVFKKLTSIAPDYHYAVGDLTGDLSLRVVDLICPVGRGQRGLIVAPPRSGKTILLQQFTKAMEEHYPDVEVMVLLVDERPEEATEWQRTIDRGQVFVSTNDEMARRHVDLAEAVWKRARRMVELGREVFLVIDSITRLGRAYNNLQGPGGRTMSGGVDTRAMERPKQFFGSARNTEEAGSLTILGTTLIETGSRMDQVIFEEFKGTGNMELVLSRKLSDRRIFPAIDIQRSGTRKEERMLSDRKLKLITTLRRVLLRMNFIEALELLVTKLDDFEDNDEFLARFEIDPEA